MANCGFGFGVWEDPPGRIWENFTHDVNELFMLVEGEVELIIKDKILFPKVGQEILIPTKAAHTVKNIGKVKS